MAPPGIPKTTSTPAASSDRIRLWAPVMPLTGSAAASAIVRAVVSTPRVACAAASVGAPVRPALLVVLISTISLGAGGVRRRTPVGFSGAVTGRRPANKKPLVPVARRGGASVGGTGALADRYEQTSARHSHTVRLPTPRSQPRRLTTWDEATHSLGQHGRHSGPAVEESGVERVDGRGQVLGSDRAAEQEALQVPAAQAAQRGQLARGLHAL